jgi:hypothetical protein
MIFELPIYDRMKKSGLYKTFDSEEFVSFLLKNTSLNFATFIGHISDERRIYKLRV